MSDYGDGATGVIERVDVWDKKDANEQQWWNELVLAQSGVEQLLQQQPQQQQQQPQLPSAAAPNPWPPPKAPLPPQQSVAAQPLPLLSPPEEFSGDGHEEVVVQADKMV